MQVPFHAIMFARIVSTYAIDFFFLKLLLFERSLHVICFRKEIFLIFFFENEGNSICYAVTCHALTNSIKSFCRHVLTFVSVYFIGKYDTLC